MQQLASQVQTDPDEVFQQHRKTCSLDEVFGHSGEPAYCVQLLTVSQLMHVPHSKPVVFQTQRSPGHDSIYGTTHTPADAYAAQLYTEDSHYRHHC